MAILTEKEITIDQGLNTIELIALYSDNALTEIQIQLLINGMLIKFSFGKDYMTIYDGFDFTFDYVSILDLLNNDFRDKLEKEVKTLTGKSWNQ